MERCLVEVVRWVVAWAVGKVVKEVDGGGEKLGRGGARWKEVRL